MHVFIQQRALNKISSQSLNQISHIHRHLLNSSIVKSLDIPKNPLVFFSNKVNSDSFPAKTTTTTNPDERRPIKRFSQQVEKCATKHGKSYLWM